MEYNSATNRVRVKPGDFLNVGSKYYKYYGKFESIKEVPYSDCVYVISGGLYIRRIDLKRIQYIKSANKKEVKDTSDKLDLGVKPDDNELLIMMKEAMSGYTKNDFKLLFDDDSEMNNMRRAIENGNGQFSWIRFTTMCKKLGIKYHVKILKREKIINETEQLDDKENENE